ncbi:MAG: alpha/beta hydrolase [Candidatus Promineifilaceae bacterium]|nr:alpha/beta hydrolase [Candidatus Promineifilaceae bacterium]
MADSNRAASGMAPVNGARLYYEAEGAGEPLLLLHAGVADSRMWEQQAPAFAEHYWVIRCDLRGFGRTEVPPGPFAYHDDVAGLLDFLEVESAHLLGCSFGAQIALDVALAYPQRVRSLILGAPSVGGETPSRRIRRFWEQEEAALEEGDLEAAVELNLRLWVDGPQRTPAMVDGAVRRRVHTMQLEAFQKEVPEGAEWQRLSPPAIQRLDAVQAPALILVGQLDLEEKRVLARRLEREIDGATAIVVDGAAHMLSMERPRTFNRHVLDFLGALPVA